MQYWHTWLWTHILVRDEEEEVFSHIGTHSLAHSNAIFKHVPQVTVAWQLVQLEGGKGQGMKGAYEIGLDCNKIR